MMKQVSIICLFFLFCAGTYAQESKGELYHPEADARADIENALKKAGQNGKHVFLQIGGNWCSWCLAFNGLVTSNDTLRNYIAEHYEVVHVNYSKENKNDAVLASLGYPQRFGFPVFVILDGQGNRLHTQNSAYLEEGKGHSAQEVLSFLKAWSPSALDPKSYQ